MTDHERTVLYVLLREVSVLPRRSKVRLSVERLINAMLEEDPPALPD